jgi:PadR family transcriptional regulator PadR
MTMNTNMKRTNPDFLNGVPELLILRLLDRRPMHGYDIVQAIKVQSREMLDFGEGCIYPVLHRLEHEKHLASKRELVAGRNRIVYRLTAQGRRRLAATRAGWEQVVAAISAVLEGGEHDAALA